MNYACGGLFLLWVVLCTVCVSVGKPSEKGLRKHLIVILLAFAFSIAGTLWLLSYASGTILLPTLMLILSKAILAGWMLSPGAAPFFFAPIHAALVKLKHPYADNRIFMSDNTAVWGKWSFVIAGIVLAILTPMAFMIRR